MGMASDSKQVPPYDPTYREQDVDETIEDHDNRITRLERAALVGLGYVLATAPEIIGQVLQFL